MRLPVTVPLQSRDGTSNKDSRLTNVLKETGASGDVAALRPGLHRLYDGSGAGGGIVAFNGELVSVYGTTLGNYDPYKVPTITVTPGDFSPNSIYNGVFTSSTNCAAVMDEGAQYRLYTGNPITGLSVDSTGFSPATSAGAEIGTSGTSIVIWADGNFYRSAVSPISFSVVAAFTADEIQFMSYSNGVYVLPHSNTGGTTGLVQISSDDGLTWSTKTITISGSPTQVRMTNCIYDGSKWVLLGSKTISGVVYPLIVTTPDMVTFTELSVSGIAADVALTEGLAATANNTYFISVEFDAGDSILYQSTDLQNWTSALTSLTAIYVAEFGSSVLVSGNFGATNKVYITLNDTLTFVDDVSTLYGSAILIVDTAGTIGISGSGADYATYEFSSIGGVIDSLGTVATGIYDFAQSPI